MSTQKITYYCHHIDAFVTPVKDFDFPAREHFLNIDWLVARGEIPPADWCVIWNDSNIFIHPTFNIRKTIKNKTDRQKAIYAVTKLIQLQVHEYRHPEARVFDS